MSALWLLQRKGKLIGSKLPLLLYPKGGPVQRWGFMDAPREGVRGWATDRGTGMFI